MMNAKAKTINLLLYEGDLGGVISIEDSSWNSGEMYSAPRESVEDLLKTDACNKFGVYFLLSQDMVYIGQSSDLSKRITQHTIGKEWWTSVVILTTKDDNLTRTDIDYLEYVLIEKAMKTGRLDCDNKKKGNPPKVDKFRRVFLQQYLDEAMFLMNLIGINVFSEKNEAPSANSKNTLIDTMSIHERLAIGKNAKKDAVEYVKAQGIPIGKNVTYAVRQENKDVFWANPNIKLLDNDWELILNNNESEELLVLKVPANTLALKTEKQHGLSVRKDKPDRIHLNLKVESMKDETSDIDFSRYIVKKVKY